MQDIIFDAHLDLAAIAVNKRDMHERDLSKVDRPWPPAAVTLPSLEQGNVRFALATIFTERDGDGPEGYPEGDADRAAIRARAQLEAYLTWRDEGHLSLGLRPFLMNDPGVGEIKGGMGVAEPEPYSIAQRLRRLKNKPPLIVGLLMENADPIRTPEDVPFWKSKGLLAVGLTWARASRYASGNATPADEDTGITELGRELIAALDEHAIVHDLSHLSQKSTEQLLSITNRPVIASHSNCRALLHESDQRHLADETIHEIARRGGVIGLVLARNFVEPEGNATIDLAIDHVERICDLVGSRTCVGIGSDMDGGFGADDLVQGIRAPKDLAKLAIRLGERGWSDTEVRGFTHLNWLRFFEASINTKAHRAARA
ncbi:membrane dipeptidase [Planctomycetaceae bacterium AH-315-I19]|nr:membrane dipeptidase [Planctomycetaceae bacterium AH-315-I19]